MTAPPARYPGRAPIEAYGNGGFRFAQMSHRGSILCLPSGIYAWERAEPNRLCAYARVLEESAALTLLLVGTGQTLLRPATDVAQALARSGVSLEVMDTGAACRTYNVLLAEGRPVAAALVAVA
jgi:uncharacterized protein